MPPKRVADPDSDASYCSLEDEHDDSYRPSSSKSTKKSRTAKRAPRARKRVKGDHAVESGTESDTHGDAPRHSNALHTIAEPEPLREALLAWYADVHEVRGMPWRKPYNPALDEEQRAQRAYEVWISEIMLQQTQVATVIPYYTRWMEKFPTIRDLAASDIETVNGLWKGLGYYSRAARLLAGAQKAVAELGGRLPNNAHDMERAVPGIGRYSAGAICSIAYNECVPVLDGNVHRLLSRVLALYAPPKAKPTLDVLWKAAAEMVRRSTRAGDVNQAMIELGATAFAHHAGGGGGTSNEGERKEKDVLCPALDKTGVKTDVAGLDVDMEDLCTLCEPLPSGSLVTCFPMKAVKKKAREEVDVVNVIEWRCTWNGAGAEGTDSGDGRYFLLVRRPERGLLAGLHEFPTAANVDSALTPAAQRALAHSITTGLLAAPVEPCRAGTSGNLASGEGTVDDSLRIVQIVDAGDVVHVFSHIRKTYRVQWVALTGGKRPPHLAASSTPGGRSGTEVGGRRQAGGKSRSARERRLTGERSSEAREDEPLRIQATWTPMAEVADANIGTGVLKVWRQVCTLWDTGSRK
ncbi:uncharacterized protein FIBRA_01119 [Fibroporia radiculosa]|uniref:Adenine DNA glycosylase n=1 Tax=Fibroporia radiculosa TaxID=599839 RepID=J4GJC7_9APHY|nr:uncharacterized protein FIBRA_01119 [Fibroporia radiculosa]CCL99105.1 predicted protein [Fibroporia radiculosa]